jgi:hypothetical protein
MEGQAVADLDGPSYNGGKGTLVYLMKDPAKAPLFEHLKDENGQWVVRDDVWFSFKTDGTGLRTGPQYEGEQL